MDGGGRGIARELQAAPYPDDWPQVECFCSVLLKNGQRVIALARYGLSDHTASQRRGGLELIGVVGPADTDAGSALAIYDWLRRQHTTRPISGSWGTVPLSLEFLAIYCRRHRPERRRCLRP